MWQGFKQFFGKILKYLLEGVLDWLTGQLKDAAIEVPSDWSFGGVVKLLLSVLGVTLGKIWKLLGKKIGDPVVEKLKKALSFLTGAWEWVAAVITEGPVGLWKKLKEQVGQLKEMMIGAIAGYLSETLIVQASAKILTALNPVGAIVNAIILAYKAIQTAAQYARQILEIVSKVLDVASDLAAGAVGGAANVIETLLGKALTIAIGFLANYLNLGGFGRKVAEMVKKIQDAVEQGIDRILDWAIAAGKSVLNALGLGGKKQDDKKSDAGDAITPATFTAGGATHRVWIEPSATAGVMLASKPTTVAGYVAALSTRIQKLPNSDPEKPSLAADIVTVGTMAAQLSTAFASVADLKTPKKEDAEKYRTLVERIRNLVELAAAGEHTGSLSDPIPITWYKPWPAYPNITLNIRGASKNYAPGEQKDLDVGGRFADLETIGGRMKIGVARANQPEIDKKLTRVAASARGLGTADRFAQVLATFGYAWTGMNADHVRDLGLGGLDQVDNLWPLDAGTNRAGNRVYDQWVWVKEGDDVRVAQVGQLEGKTFRIARMQ
jgi:hypothetical protein